jgi:hypothetical protein
MICSWHLSDPSGSQTLSGRTMNSRRTSIHPMKAGNAGAPVRPLMLRPISLTRWSGYRHPDNNSQQGYAAVQTWTDSDHPSLLPQFTGGAARILAFWEEMPAWQRISR